VFDRHSGIDLVDAVASTSNGYRIGENRYINGGYRRSENADLAAGYGRVRVLSPFGGRSRMPLEWGMDLATQVDELRAGAAGSRPSFRTAARVTSSTPMRWIHPRVCRPHEEATTKAERSRSCSPNSGTDPAKTSRLGEWAQPDQGTPGFRPVVTNRDGTQKRK